MQDLYKWYVEEKLGTREIAKRLGVSQPTAVTRLKQAGIVLRTYKDNKIPTKKGERLSYEHKLRISSALKGNNNWKDSYTGLHFNYQRKKCSV